MLQPAGSACCKPAEHPAAMWQRHCCGPGARFAPPAAGDQKVCTVPGALLQLLASAGTQSTMGRRPRIGSPKGPVVCCNAACAPPVVTTFRSCAACSHSLRSTTPSLFESMALKTACGLTPSFKPPADPSAPWSVAASSLAVPAAVVASKRISPLCGAPCGLPLGRLWVAPTLTTCGSYAEVRVLVRGPPVVRAHARASVLRRSQG